MPLQGKPHIDVGRLRSEFLAGVDQQLRFAAGDRTVNGPAPWWTEVDGVLFLRLRFRGAVLKVNGEADTALLYSLDEVIRVLGGVRSAVESGRLDGALLRAADA